MVVKSKVKYTQSLSQKKQRDADRVFVAEGPKIINELLSEPSIELKEIFALKQWLVTHNKLPSERVHEIDEVMLGRLSFLTTPNQVLGIFGMPDTKPLQLKGNVSLMADGIQDPGNMGSVIRCADWFGIRQVICSRDCADVFNPKTVQSTMGSVARVNVYYEDLASLLHQHKDIDVYATTLGGKNLNEMKPLKEGIIVIGNESKGISKELIELSTHQVTIPKKGNAESLNAAVATGIVLSHLIR
jgi:RNA methyltransferase, TrmH family